MVTVCLSFPFWNLWNGHSTLAQLWLAWEQQVSCVQICYCCQVLECSIKWLEFIWEKITFYKCGIFLSFFEYMLETLCVVLDHISCVLLPFFKQLKKPLGIMMNNTYILFQFFGQHRGIFWLSTQTLKLLLETVEYSGHCCNAGKCFSAVFLPSQAPPQSSVNTFKMFIAWVCTWLQHNYWILFC